jgi:hypothetical protein
MKRERREVEEPSKVARSLSVPGQTLVPQFQSGFFRLSAELRNTIYDHLVDKELDIHVALVGGRLESGVCGAPKNIDDYLDSRNTCIGCHPGRGENADIVPSNEHFVGVLGFASCCRQAQVSL